MHVKIDITSTSIIAVSSAAISPYSRNDKEHSSNEGCKADALGCRPWEGIEVTVSPPVQGQPSFGVTKMYILNTFYPKCILNAKMYISVYL